jgi:hypothetical protein
MKLGGVEESHVGGGRLVSILLWHFTRPECVDSIRRSGFREGDSGVVYFTTPPDTYWEADGEVLLEVTFNVTEAELTPYGSEVVDDERWDQSAKAFVKVTDPVHIYRRFDYRVPAAFVNDHAVMIRLVPPEEYRRRHGF